MWHVCRSAYAFARITQIISVAFSLETHLSPLLGAMAARDVTAPPPQSPVATARDLSPPPAPGPRRFNRKTCGGQVLLESVEVRLISGNLLAEVRSNDESSLPDEFWYTGQLRTQIASLLCVEVCRLTLVDVKGKTVSDEECVIEGPLTAIVGPQLEEPLAFEGVVALRA